MDKKVSEWLAPFVGCLTVLAVEFYNLGIAGALELDLMIGAFVVWVVFFFASVAVLAGGLFCPLLFTTIYCEGEGEEWGPVITSVLFVVIGFFLGEISSVIPWGAPEFASVLSCDSLFPVFWKPYLASFVFSLILFVMMKIEDWYEAI